ncbi:MAG: AP2/ERF family transcription factor [Sedimentisphaerales bacterium]
MSKIHFSVPIPTFIENIILYFVLCYRKKHYGYPFRLIKLTKNRYAKVDPQDYPVLSKYDWHLLEAKGRFYTVKLNEGLIQSMHRFLMDAPKGRIVDHRNGDGLDNRRANLRLATHSQNCCNKRITKKGTSKYRGVSIEKGSKKWRATIYYNKINIPLGFFENEQDAARAYDNAAKKYHGEFAVLNFPLVASGVG